MNYYRFVLANAIAAVLSIITSELANAAEISPLADAVGKQQTLEQLDSDRSAGSESINGSGIAKGSSQPVIGNIKDFDSPATTVKDWVAQTEEADRAALIQITAVKLNRTETELEIILETADGKELQIDASKFATEGNALIADIDNAVLALPDGQAFQAENPAPDIAKITVEQQNPTYIRISVVGDQTLPKTDVVLKTGAFSYSLNPDSEAAEEEIVVTGAGQDGYSVPNASTATGTDTPIMETPFSVQVIPQALIRDQQVTEIQEALSNVSSVSYFGSNSGREAAFSIRGFGGNFSNSAPTLRDGFRIYGSFQAIPEVANLQQIEVLKGPSSILYGQSEPGGIINLVSKQPLAEPFYEAELQGGSRSLVRPRIDVSGPLTANGNLLYRLNALYKHEESFRDFDTATNRFSVAPALTWKIDDRTDLKLSLEYINDNSPADFGISSFKNGVAPVPRDRVINDPNDTIATNYLSLGYSFERRLSDDWKLRNGFRYIHNTSNYSVVALPFTVEGETVTRFYADQDNSANSYALYTNLVGNFKTGSVKHTLLAGIDLNQSDEQIVSIFGGPSLINIFDPDYNLAAKPNRSDLLPFNDTLTTAKRLGLYLQDQIYLLDNLVLVAGLRYDLSSQTINNVETEFTAGGESSQTNNAFTPRIGLLYNPIKELSLFANYSQSFNPNTVTTARGSLLEPERGSGFEVGIKTELLNQKLLATLTYFDIRKQNVAVTDPDFPLFSIAVGEQNSKGVEFDISGEILPGWKLIGSYAYIDAKVTNDIDPTIIGNPLFGIPKNSASLWTTYEIQTGVLKGVGFGIGFNYVGDRTGNLANSFQVGSYLTGNAALFYRRDRYRFGINLKNISNAYFIESVRNSDAGIYPGDPLTVIGSFSVTF
ncbi:MAG: TonB-dependent siderophore receptor [Aphanocapsa sp. GSE-SYN-MK-11-07L]|nr:TonB-dependent siderophore receptor [Aphanocapsa sp. GSE-SYN-MK-11-07L]